VPARDGPLDEIRRTVPARAERRGDFLLVTDVGPEAAAKALDVLQQADTALDALLGEPSPHGERPVIWITSRADVGGAACRHSASELHEAGALGFFSCSCGAIHVAASVDPKDEDVVRRVLLHEAVHQRLAVAGLPRLAGPGSWIDEGLATLFESLTSDGALDVEALDRISIARALSDAELLLPLARFLDLDREGTEGLGDVEAYYVWKSIVYHHAVPRLHTQAFAVMAFLHETLGEGFPAFLAQGLRDGGSARLVRSCTGLRAGRLQATFARWLDRIDPLGLRGEGGKR